MPEAEKFLIDSDCDPTLVGLLRRLGFHARSILAIKIPNNDTAALRWCNRYGYILVCHDKHRDAQTRYSFYSEMYYRGGKVIRISGEPGQDALFALGKILVHRPKWQEHFADDNGQAVVHPSGCNFTSAAALFERSNYRFRLPFDDPAVPISQRRPLTPRRRRRRDPPEGTQPLPGV